MNALTLKLAQIVATAADPAGGPTQPFLVAFRKLRRLGMPCAYELALVAGTIDTHVNAYQEAHRALVQRYGVAQEEGGQQIIAVPPERLPEFYAALQELQDKPVTLPITTKLKLGRLDAQLCADDLVPLLDLVEL